MKGNREEISSWKESPRPFVLLPSFFCEDRDDSSRLFRNMKKLIAIFKNLFPFFSQRFLIAGTFIKVKLKNPIELYNFGVERLPPKN